MALTKVFDLPKVTPVLKICTVLPETISTQYTTYLQSIEYIRAKFKIDYPVNHDDIYNNNFVNQLIKMIYINSFPLRTIQKPIKYLAWWEVLNKLRPILSKAFDDRKDKFGKRLPLKNASFRSFHISGVQSAECMKVFINQVAPYNWEFLGTLIGTTAQLNYLNKTEVSDPVHWLQGVENDGIPTIANLKMWKNKVTTDLKTLNLCLSDDDDFVIPAVFAITTLSDGGSAILRVNKVVNTAQYSMIVMLSSVFEKCQILRTTTDQIFIVAISKQKTDNKLHSHLMKFLTYEPNMASAVDELFSENLIATHDIVLEALNSVYDTRYEYYYNLFEIINEFKNGDAGSPKNIEKLASELFPDISKKWSLMYNF